MELKSASKRNRHGLARHIPRLIKEEIRRRCKFGCVLCRSGFYQYEHVEDFADATAHDPDKMCCLCASCHDRVTRGQLSKAAVVSAYAKIREADEQSLEPVSGPLDFHTGTANLMIGGLTYSPMISKVLRFHGQDIFTVRPGLFGEPGMISAVFFDDAGKEIFQLNENEWVGLPGSWDIEVKGSRFTVRNDKGRIVLALRLEPPGTVVIERLDMRLPDSHVLISEGTYAIGRLNPKNQSEAIWFFSELVVESALPDAIGLEFAYPEELIARQKMYEGRGQSMADASGNYFSGSPVGCQFVPAGLSVGYLTAFRYYSSATIRLSLEHAREYVLKRQINIGNAFADGLGK